MIEPLTEPLDQGLVDKSRSTSSSEPGELDVAIDCYYDPDDQSPRAIPGRSVWFADNIAPQALGNAAVHHLRFSNRDPVVLYRNPSWIVVKSGDVLNPVTTEPATLETGGPHSIIHYRNKFFLLDGVNPTQVVTSDFKTEVIGNVYPRTYRLGFEPMTLPVTLSVFTPGGGIFWGAGLGYFWYWYTEYDHISELESQYNASPVMVQIISSSTAVRVVIPGGTSPINSRAKWYRIYRAKTENTLEPDFASGRLIGALRIGSGSSNNVFEDVGVLDPNEIGGPFHPVLSSSTGWVNAGRVIDAPIATYPLGVYDPAYFPDGTTNGYTPGTEQALVLKVAMDPADWSALQGGLPVVGIEVRLNWLVTTPVAGTANAYAARVRVDISPDNGTTWLTDGLGERIVGVWTMDEPVDPDPPSPNLITFGGPENSWLTGDGSEYEWVASSFADNKILIRIVPRVWQTVPIGAFDVKSRCYDADIRLYAEGTTLATADIAYPTLPTPILDLPTDWLGPAPPASSTGTVFEDALVLNDTADRTRLVFSLVDDPEIFPPAYFLPIDLPVADEIVCLNSTQDFLMVGMTRHIVRVDYLPSAENFAVSRGRVFSVVSNQHGIVGPLASDLVHVENAPTLIAFIDRNFGLCGFDGHRVYQLVEGLDWAGHVDKSKLDKSILINYPRWAALVFYFSSAKSNYLDSFMVFHYHPSQLRKSGRFKVTGPCKIPESVYATLRNDPTDGIGILLRTAGGKTYLEDAGTLDESKIGRRMRIRTREIFPLGIGSEAKIERLYVRYANLTDTIDMAVRLVRTDSGHQSIVDQQVVQSFGAQVDGTVDVGHDGQLGESFHVEIEALPHNAGSEQEIHNYSLSIDELTLMGANFGRED